MGSNPLNLAIRFLLELAALTAMGVWGWHYSSETWLKFILAIGVPLVVAVTWGLFNVPNDPSRSGNAPIAVPGIIRLIIELAVFALAFWALHDLEYIRLSWLLCGVVILHYLVSYDRIIWLVKQ